MQWILSQWLSLVFIFLSFSSLVVKNLFVLFKQHLFCQNVLTDFFFHRFLIKKHKLWSFNYFILLSSLSFLSFIENRKHTKGSSVILVHDKHVTWSKIKLPDLPGESRGRNTPGTFYHKSAWFILLKAVFHILYKKH